MQRVCEEEKRGEVGPTILATVFEVFVIGVTVTGLAQGEN